jgi:hypothetical protein
MDQTSPTPTSFIPKKPLDTTARSSGGALGSLAFLLSLLIFIPSLIAAGGVFAYKQYLTQALAQKTASLQAAEAAFDPTVIAQLERLDTRMNSAETLLQSHVAPSALFDFLAAQTIPSVQFTNFSYTLNPDGSASLSLTGVGQNFAAVALQSDQLGASSMLKDIAFSNVTIGQNGLISFSVTATVQPTLINYGKNLSSVGSTLSSAVPNQVAATSTASSTPSTIAPPQP